jgi:hypothetical protein
MKAGYKTTEFWLAVITSVATFLNQSGALGALVLPVETIATIAGVVGSYIVSRGIAK